MAKKNKTKHPFNKTQIKDGWIVILRKDGRIKTKIEPYQAKHPVKLDTK